MPSAGVPHICRYRRERVRGSPAAVRIQFWLGSFCQHYYLDTVKEDCGLLTDSDIFHRRWVGHHCHDPWQWCFSNLWNCCFPSDFTWGVFSSLVWPIQLRIIWKLSHRKYRKLANQRPFWPSNCRLIKLFGQRDRRQDGQNNGNNCLLCWLVSL